jgi:hypothetical protein
MTLPAQSQPIEPNDAASQANAALGRLQQAYDSYLEEESDENFTGFLGCYGDVAELLSLDAGSISSLNETIVECCISEEGAEPAKTVAAIEFLLKTIPAQPGANQVALIDNLCYLAGMTYDPQSPETHYLKQIAELLKNTDIDVRKTAVHNMAKGTPGMNKATHVLTVNTILLACDPDADIQSSASSTIYSIGRWYPGGPGRKENALDLGNTALGCLAMGFKNEELAPRMARMLIGELSQFATFDSDPDLRPHFKERAPHIFTLYKKIEDLVDGKPELKDVFDEIEEERGYIYSMHPEFDPARATAPPPPAAPKP